MTQGLVIQDPAETLPYAIDWSATLGADTITASVWAIDPSAGVTLADQAHTTTAASANVSGLALGQVYLLINTITTAAGETYDDDWTVRAFPT